MRQLQDPGASALFLLLELGRWNISQTTPLWRRSENGTLCNACSLYLKMKGTNRPVSLKSDVIKHRNRSKGETAKKQQQQKAAAAASATMAQYPPEMYPGYGMYGHAYRGPLPGGGEAGEGDGEPRDGTRHGEMSPKGRGRGSTSRGRSDRRSDSSDSRGYDAPSHPMMHYPMFYYPQNQPPQAMHQPYPFPYPPSPEWQHWMHIQAMQQHHQHLANSGGVHPGLTPQQGYPGQQPTSPFQGFSNTPLAPFPQPLPAHLHPPAQAPNPAPTGSDEPFVPAQTGPHSSTSQLWPAPFPPLHAVAGATPTSPRTAAANNAAAAAHFHPYQRFTAQHARPDAALSDTRMSLPGDTLRRSVDAGRPSSTSSSGSADANGMIIGTSQQATTADAMTVDEGDSPQRMSEGGPARRRGRSSTRKASILTTDFQDRLGQMRMAESMASLLPAGMKMPELPETLRGIDEEDLDEVSALKSRLRELEFANGLLQARVVELESGRPEPTADDVANALAMTEA